MPPLVVLKNLMRNGSLSIWNEMFKDFRTKTGSQIVFNGLGII